MEKYFFLLLVNCILLAGCKKHYNEQIQTEVTSVKNVTAQKLRLNDDPVAIVASGILASASEVNLSFKTGGIIQNVYVSEGDFVHKGQVLAELDLTEINSHVKKNRTVYDKALRDFERINNLYQDSAATLEQKQNTSTAVEIARAGLETAEFNLSHSRLVAPVNGKILGINMKEGEFVASGKHVLYFAGAGNAGSQMVRVGIADKDVLKLNLKDSAAISFDAMPGRAYSAGITEIAETANKFTGTYQIELTLDTYNPELKNGFFADVKIYPAVFDSAFRIPMKALLEGNGKQVRIFISENGITVKNKLLQVSEIQNDYFLVSTDQLPDPVWIIIDGASYLSENDSVAIVNY